MVTPAPAVHTVAIAFARSALRAVAPAARARLLREVGVAPAALADDAARLPAAAFGALWLAVARELDDEFFGLDSRRMKPGSFALLTHAVAGEPSVGRALSAVLRGFALLLDDIAARLVLAGGEARIVVDNRIVAQPQPDEARRFADETLLVMVHGLLCWLAGRRVAPLRLEWAHPRPAHADEYDRMFTPAVRFDAVATVLVFDARVLLAPVAVSAASLKAFLRDAPSSVFLKQVAGSTWADRLRRELRGASVPPTIDALASRHRLSPATLRRRLDAEGTSWQRLKDEVRRDQAIRHLAERNLPLADIAERLGFADPSAFHRAFRKWTGTAPGQWRGTP